MPPLPSFHTYTNTGVLVVYLYGALSLEDVRVETRLLETFTQTWNASGEQTAPIATIVVRREQHQSDDKREHITVALSTQEMWEHNPRQSKASVHLYSRNDNPSDGYEGHWVVSRDRNKYSSRVVLAWLDAALKNYVPRPE